MSLSYEQWKALRGKGLSNEQILKFEKGNRPSEGISEKQFETIGGAVTEPVRTLGTLGGLKLPSVIEKVYGRGKEFKGGMGRGVVSGVNAATYNLANALSKRAGINMLPNATTPEQKGGEFAGTIVGYGLSPITAAGSKISKAPETARLLTKVGRGALGGATLGGAYTSDDDIKDVKGRLTRAGIGALLGGGAAAVSGGLGAIRKYPKEKLLKIREGAKGYHRDEVKEYGNMLKNLSKTGEQVDVEPTMEQMTKMMIDRGLYDPVNGKWAQPLNKVDRQLVKTYETLLREMKKSGNKVGIDKVIREYELLRDSGGVFKEPTQAGKAAINTADEFFNSIKPQIKSDVFTKGQARYADFKQNMDVMDKYFSVWESPKMTASGEKFIGTGLGTSEEARLAQALVAKKAGQTLKGGELMSKGTRIYRSPYARIGFGAGMGYGGYKLLK